MDEVQQLKDKLAQRDETIRLAVVVMDTDRKMIVSQREEIAKLKAEVERLRRIEGARDHWYKMYRNLKKEYSKIKKLLKANTSKEQT